MNKSSVPPLDEQAKSQPHANRGTGEMAKRYLPTGTQIQGMRQVPITSEWLGQPQFRFPAAARLSEYLLHVKFNLVLYDVITRLAYLAGQSLGRNHLLAPRLLPLMPALRFRTIPAYEIRCFNICPAQIPVPVLPIILPLLLLVRHPR